MPKTLLELACILPVCKPRVAKTIVLPKLCTVRFNFPKSQDFEITPDSPSAKCCRTSPKNFLKAAACDDISRRQCASPSLKPRQCFLLSIVTTCSFVAPSHVQTQKPSGPYLL